MTIRPQTHQNLIYSLNEHHRSTPTQSEQSKAGILAAALPRGMNGRTKPKIVSPQQRSGITRRPPGDAWWR
jgi:hypothetical protein